MNLKILNIKDLSNKFKKRGNKIIALSHGVFDLIHHGHLRHFDEVKKNSDLLVVSVTADKYINKGDNRPYFNLQDRMYALSKIESIDFLVESNSKSSFEIIKKIKPNLYCKGPDYKDLSKDRTKKIYTEKNIVEKNGGKLFITSSKTSSSSKLINSEFIFTKEQLEFLKKIRKKNDLDKIIKILDNISNQEVFIFGESIIDIYNKLNVLNKSGKESVLNFLETRSPVYLGGVLSVANHISNFVKKIKISSYIGEDKKYLSLINQRLSKNIKFNFYSKKNSPTIEKKRYIDDYSNKKIIGIYNVNDDFIDENIEKKIINTITKIPRNKLIMAFNYGHGLFTKKIIKSLTKKRNCFKSINSQLNSSSIGYHSLSNYPNFDFLCMNELEIRHELRDRNTHLRYLIKKLSKKNNANFLIVTRGKKGLILFNKKKKKFYSAPGFANTVNDKVGAGDSMIPIIALCLMNKVDEELSILLGSIFSAESIKHEANNFNFNKNQLLNTIETMLKV